MGCGSAKSKKEEQTLKNSKQRKAIATPTAEKQSTNQQNKDKESKNNYVSKESGKAEQAQENMGDAPILEESALDLESLEKWVEVEEDVELALMNKEMIVVKKENGTFFIDYVRNNYCDSIIFPSKSDLKIALNGKEYISLVKKGNILNQLKLRSSAISRMTVVDDIMLIGKKNGELTSIRAKDKRLKITKELNIKADLVFFDVIEDELIILNSKFEVFMLNNQRLRLVVRDIGKLYAISAQRGCVWVVDKNSTVSAYELHTCKKVASFSFEDEIISAFFLKGQVVMVGKEIIRVASLEGEMLKETKNATNSCIFKVSEASTFVVLASNKERRLEIWDRKTMEIVKFEELSSPLLFG